MSDGLPLCRHPKKDRLPTKLETLYQLLTGEPSERSCGICWRVCRLHTNTVPKMRPTQIIECSDCDNDRRTDLCRRMETCHLHWKLVADGEEPATVYDCLDCWATCAHGLRFIECPACVTVRMRELGHRKITHTVRRINRARKKLDDDSGRRIGRSRRGQQKSNHRADRYGRTDDELGYADTTHPVEGEDEAAYAPPPRKPVTLADWLT